MRLVLITSFFVFSVGFVTAKKFTPCEVAQALLTAGVDRLQIPRLLCAAQKASDFESNVFSAKLSNTNYGMFELDNLYWCKSSKFQRSFNKCNTSCYNLNDDDLADDAECARRRLERGTFLIWNNWDQCASSANDESILGEGCKILQVNN